MFDEIDLSRVQDEYARELLVRLLNVLEAWSQRVREVEAENARLEAENAQLRGGNAKPAFPPTEHAGQGDQDYSSERERQQRTPRERRSKLEQIEVTREEVVALAPEAVPADAIFKGYEEVVIQDLTLAPDNVRFRKEKYYSPSEGRSYLAPLPAGYDGQYGPGIRALVLVWYFASNMSEPKILELLQSLGVVISAGQVSNLLIKDHEPFHQERQAAFEAGVASSPWHHHDQTATRVQGQEQTCQITTNPLYTNYHTTERKDRTSILEALQGGQPLRYYYNQEAQELLDTFGVGASTRARLAEQLPREQWLDEASLSDWL
jgi:hypothetical protein